MAFELKNAGNTFDRVQKTVEKVQREYFKQIGKDIRPVVKRAVATGRRLIAQLFRGRGRRLKRAFASSIRARQDDVVTRFGYIKGRQAFIGRFYEGGAQVRIRTKKKTGKKLWVPVGENRGANGMPIMTAKEFYTSLQGRSVVKMSSRGNLVAFRADGGELTPMFVLKDSVALKARPVLEPTAKEYLPAIEQAAGRTFNKIAK